MFLRGPFRTLQVIFEKPIIRCYVRLNVTNLTEFEIHSTRKNFAVAPARS